MLPEIIAIISAMGWAGDSVLVRLGARKSSVLAAAFLSYLVSALSLWTYLLFFSSPDLLWSPAVVYFFLGGCLQPLFAAAIAVVFLGERPSFWVYVGTVVIVVSVWLISRRQSGEIRWRLFDIVFPLGAALVAAVSQNLRKAGLQILPDPFIGTAVSTSTSLVLYFGFLAATGKLGALRIQRESMPFFGSAAFVSALAQVLNFVALSRGEVSVLVPLFNTTPLFTVLFSSLFLREVETVTTKIVLGAVLMMAGVIIITSR